MTVLSSIRQGQHDRSGGWDVMTEADIAPGILEESDAGRVDTVPMAQRE